MNHFEWSWQQADVKVFAQGWNPEQTKAVVCIIHGFNEHSGRYTDAATRLERAGYAVLTYDHFGHGKTEGKRGHVPGYDAFLDAVQAVVAEAKKRFAGKKIFLWGHSMGGGIVLNYLLRRQPEVAGAIVTAPLLKLAFEPPAFKVFLAKMMQNIYPAFTESAPVDASAVSRDQNEVRKYEQDPFNHGKITAGTFFGFFNAGLYALDHAAELKTPILLMHGTGDKLTSYAATKEFATKAPKNLVTLKIWDGFYHELHNEPEADRAQVFATMINWLDGK